MHVIAFFSRIRHVMGRDSAAFALTDDDEAGGASPSARKKTPTVRIGLVGASNIAPPAVIIPCKYSTKAVVHGVATRNSAQRAKDYAAKHGIPKSYGSYAEMIADPEIDAVYIGNANGDHYRVCINAMRAGKHVLCEKPIASNEREAAHMIAEAEKCGVRLMEASHAFHHPAAAKARELVRTGQIGDVKSVEVNVALFKHFFSKTDIRNNDAGRHPELAGGWAMDLGVYAVNALRFFVDAGRGAVEVTECKAEEIYPGTDSHMDVKVNLKLKSPLTGGDVAAQGKVDVGIRNDSLFTNKVKIVGTLGELEYKGFIAPFVIHTITLKRKESNGRTKTTTTKEYADGRSTYDYQMDEFVRQVEEIAASKRGGIAHTKAAGTIDEPDETMRVIDEMYRKAGMKPRNDERALME